MTQKDFAEAIRIAENRALWWRLQESAAMYQVWHERTLELRRLKRPARASVGNASSSSTVSVESAD